MTPKVRFCRNVVAGAGMFILLGAVSSVVINPAKWWDGLEMFGVAFMCWTIVGQINRREGGWHKEAFIKNSDTESEPWSA